MHCLAVFCACRDDSYTINQEIESVARRTMENFVVAGLAAKDRLPFVALARLLNLVHEGAISEEQMDVFLSPKAAAKETGEIGGNALDSVMMKRMPISPGCVSIFFFLC